LANIWSQVLRIEQVGVHDRFFELGGDSILSMQVIAKANKAGLRLTLKQTFQHQTIAELALVAEAITHPRFEQGFVTGEVPLTPIQKWFFEQDYADRHHWNQARLLELRQDFEAILLERAIQQLVAHHDALRLRFQLGDAGWRQFNAGSEESVKLTLVDLATTPEADWTSVMETAAVGLQASLNLSQGPVVRAALFNFGSRRPSCLLLVIHHLAVDEVSWRILLEDLQVICEQLQSDGTIKLPAKTTSFRKWGQELAEHAHSATLEQEADYWLAVSSAESGPIPVDLSGGKNIEASVRTVSVSLDAEDTSALLQKVPQAYNTQINDVLLSALALALTSWIGQSGVRIDLEGHGREELFEGIDLSRTVGWFTTIFPVTLDLRGTVGPGEVLKSVKEQLRRIPERGIGYGMLRYLGGDDNVAAQLRSVPPPEIIFNYLGQFDQVAASPFMPVKGSIGPVHSPLARRSHLLSINSLVANGRLRIDWGYSEAVHRRGTIERLAQNFIEALRSLIHHCTSPGAGGYTPSDFVETGLDQEGLDRLISELSEATN
jgi:non-ribosomal peptide synthase protein (TIGR01720 family)